jgi:cyclopropane-fatty-acyl-phospholipid synthase
MKLVSAIPASSLKLTDQICRNLLFKKLTKLSEGCIEIVELFRGGQNFIFGNPKTPAHLRTEVRILNPHAYSRIALGGSIGTGESYAAGEWECEQLANLIRVFVRNRSLLMELDSGWGAITAPISKLLHRLRKNSIAGSQKNIHAHYDLGNDFFSLFLGKTWMYSSGVFLSPASSLDDAQTEKIDRICRKLNLSPEDHLVEIGTGWGGFAIHAAKKYGCRVTTTTISREQYEFTKQRITAEGLEDRIELLFRDYRLLEGQYDKLVSIEMIEAVGLDHLNIYFEKCSSLLKPEGQMLIQGITIRDQYYASAKKSVDFIQRYIFPGSGIPSVESISRAVTKNTDLQMSHLEDFGAHYAKTLKLWSDQLKSKRNEVLKLGYPEELYRQWQFYFGYCEGGFLERSIGVMQMLLLKPKAHREPLLGEHYVRIHD